MIKEMEPQKISKKREVFFFYGSIVFILLVISALGLLYRSAYRFENFRIVKTGTLEVSVFDEKASIFIDHEFKMTTLASEEIVKFNSLSPTKHTVVVSKDNFYAWRKNIEIAGDSLTSVAAFLIPTKPSLRKIEDYDEKNKVKALFSDNELPTEKKKRVVENIALWSDGRDILAQWIGNKNSIPLFLCEKSCDATPTQIYRLPQNVRNLDFYKDRSDIVIVSFDKGVYVIEMDKRGGQNIRPLYIGTKPSFYKTNDGVLYIEDNSEFFEVKI